MTTIYYYKELGNEPSPKERPELTLHRLDGPAVIDYDEDGAGIGEQWHLEGDKIK